MADKNRVYGFKGRYCTICDMVWEELQLGMELKHVGFPSYGLERKNCAECEGKRPEEDSPTTLAEKVETKRQELFNKHVEEHSK